MLKPVKRDNKKPYSSPIITVYGTVQELTQKVGPTGQRAIGGRFPRFADPRLADARIETSARSALQIRAPVSFLAAVSSSAGRKAPEVWLTVGSVFEWNLIVDRSEFHLLRFRPVASLQSSHPSS